MFARSLRSIAVASSTSARAAAPLAAPLRFKHAKSSHDHLVVGIQVISRMETVPELQNVLSKYGRIIHARLGLRHDTEAHGLILLDIRDNRAERDHMVAELKALEGVDVQTMRFKDPHE